MARPHLFQTLFRQQTRRPLLVNETRGVVLAGSIETAFDSRARRMRFAIDVLFIDRGGRVLKRALGLRPGRIAGTLTAFAALEFAAGSPEVAWTAVGDQLMFVDR